MAVKKKKGKSTKSKRKAGGRKMAVVKRSGSIGAKRKMTSKSKGKYKGRR